MYFKERYNLAKFGPEYGESYLDLKLLSRSQSVEYIKKVANLSMFLDNTNVSPETAISKSEELVSLSYDTVKQSLLGGKIYDSETATTRDVTKEDIDSFPPAFVGEIVSFLRGTLEKKS